MDWDWAVEKHREALRRVLVALVAMVRGGQRGDSNSLQTGFSSERTPEAMAEGSGSGIHLFSDQPPRGAALSEAEKLPATLPRRLHRAVLRLLRPAESAARRLVIVAARNLVVELPRARKPKPAPARPRKSVFMKTRCGTGVYLPHRLRRGLPGTIRPRALPLRIALPLFDPPRRIARLRRPPARDVPRISTFGHGAPRPIAIRPPPSPRDPLDAARIHLRLAALARALDDLPGHARRFARWRIRRDAAVAQRKEQIAAGMQASVRQTGRARRMSPLRGGRPPGSPRRPRHEVHDILKDLHGLAFWAMGDTS